MKTHRVCQIQERNCDRTGFLGDFNNDPVLADRLESCLVRFHKEHACALDVGDWLVGFWTFACILESS